MQAKIREILSLLLSMQYTYTKNTEYDYSRQPRPCHNFVFMLEGEGVIHSNGEKIPLKAGDILFIPKNTTYKSQWFAKPKAVFHSLHFSFQTQHDPLLNKTLPVQTLDNARFKQSYHFLKEIEKYQFRKNADSFFALSAFFAICGELLRDIRLATENPVHKTIAPAVSYIEQNYKEDFSVEYLANLCFLSPSRFFYLFKLHTGASPIVYKNKIAVQNAAQELLYSPHLSVKEIAENHGYTCIVYFERLFKKFTGKTPSQYRKENACL